MNRPLGPPRVPIHSTLGLGLLLAAGALATPAYAQETFYFGEHLDFTGNGCGDNGDLNDLTTYFAGRIRADGWTGTQFLDGMCYPQDYMESSWASGRYDTWYGDGKTLSVYAGHGYVGGDGLSFGTPHAGECDVWMSSEMALGRLSGNAASHVMYLTSCTMNIVAPAPFAADIPAYANEVWQQYGFHNSPIIQSGAGGGTFDCTSTRPNYDCFNDVTEHQFEFWFGLNSPIVYTFAQTEAEVYTKRADCKLKGGVCNGPAPEPWWYYVWNMRDAGSGPCL